MGPLKPSFLEHTPSFFDENYGRKRKEGRRELLDGESRTWTGIRLGYLTPSGPSFVTPLRQYFHLAPTIDNAVHGWRISGGRVRSPRVEICRRSSRRNKLEDAYSGWSLQRASMQTSLDIHDMSWLGTYIYTVLSIAVKMTHTLTEAIHRPTKARGAKRTQRW